MGKISWHQMSVSELELDLPLRFDVFSESGDQIASAADVVSHATKSSWLQLGFDKIYIKVLTEATDQDLLLPHNKDVIRSIESNLELTVSVIQQVTEDRHKKVTVTSMEFDELCRDMLDNIQQDSAAALQVLANSLLSQANSHASEVAERNAQLSLISMAIAQEIGLVPAECRIVGMVAMLHDISLMVCSEEEANSVEHYRQHPFLSAKLCDQILGIDPKVVIGVSQVHESPTGDGYPRGLHGSRIHRAARIVNAADAFLTLTKSTQPRMMPQSQHFHPADAIGYLMFQAKQGQFEVEVIRAIVNTMSLYPVGSNVILSDQSKATVMRSTRSTGSKPVVFRDDGKPLDLRYSGMSIVGPDRGIYETLHRSQLTDQLWT